MKTSGLLLWSMPVLASVLVFSSCGKKSSSEDSTTVNADGSTKLSAVTDVSQLGVSTALTISLPSAYSQKTSTNLNLTTAKKSQDACQMGEPITSVKESLDSVASFFCHMEVEKAKIKFGVKTTITTNGKEFGRIWIDNSKAADNQITLYMCQDGALKEKVDITGVKLGADGKPSGMKGSVQHKGSEGTQSWASDVTFDKAYSGAYLEMSGKDKYSDSSNSGSFARSVAVKLMDSSDEVSVVSLASKGTWGGQAFSQRGLGYAASNLGQALFVNSGTYNNQTFTNTHRSSFDLDGYVVAESSSTKLGEGGVLRVPAASLPAFLDASFEPSAPTGWDCGDIAETVDLDPESAAHQACEKDHKEGANCWGTEFEGGEAEAI